MLRATVIGFGILLMVAAAVLAVVLPLVMWPVAVELAIFGALVLIGTFFERHYRTRHPSDSSQWQSSGERFIDPTTGKLTDVRYNAATGERAYVPAPDRQD
jgi:membrane protein implicated in regulation of membrane protease activity